MKKSLLILVLVTLFVLGNSDPIQREVEKITNSSELSLNWIRTRVPDYEFVTIPTNLTTTYYDYQPGSYNALPLKMQPEISQPYEYTAGGAYLIFQAQETSATERRIFSTYIDPEGNIVSTSTISTENINEGFPGVDIDPVTADAFVTFHSNVDGIDGNEDLFSYDFYHISGGSGLWREPYVMINEVDLQDIIPNPDDNFVWPYPNIGPSPLGADYRRVHVYATNSTNHGAGSAHNPLIAYADFNTEDLDNLEEFDWNYYTIPQMDEWDAEDPEIQTMSHLAMVVSETDGKVAIVGWNVGHGIFAFVNENYGEGEYTYYHDDFRHSVDNPQNQDGSYRFVDAEDQPYENLNFFFRSCSYFNIMFTDDESKIRFTANMGLQAGIDSVDVWWGHCIYPKEITFDLTNGEFSFFDLYPQGANPADDNPMLPWDLDEDGIPDSYDADGIVQYVEGFPFYYYQEYAANSNFKLAKNEEKGWLAATWHDGLKARNFYDEIPGFDDWEDKPEMCIAVSGDNGQTWSEPIYMNANPNDENFEPLLANMIPCYLYPGELIEDLGEDEFGNPHGKLHLFFLDDNSYGSSVLGHGLDNGGMLKYASIDIEFPPGSYSADDEIDNFSNQIITNNYPNPFNYSTTISFNVTQTSRFVTLEIYNIKGQKVKTFPNLQINKSPNQQIIWNGTDDNNRPVSSGIYFYKVTIGNKNAMRKMILMN